jgi:hypothetical protein
MRDSIIGEDAVRALDPTQAKRGWSLITTIKRQPLILPNSNRCLNGVKECGMPEAERLHGEGKFVKVLLIANLCLWVYFWLAFAHASQPYDPRPWGHFPIDLYSF